MPLLKNNLSPDSLCALARRRVVYTPQVVADDLGVSHDMVIRQLNKRPALFPEPEPGFKKKREWRNHEAYIAVIVALCSISPYAARRAKEKLSGLEETKPNRSGKRAEIVME